VRRLRRDDFIADEMQPNHLRAFAVIEVAANGVSNRRAELVEIIGLRHDRGIDASGHIAAFQGFGYHKQDLSHAAPPQLRFPGSLLPNARRAWEPGTSGFACRPASGLRARAACRTVGTDILTGGRRLSTPEDPIGLAGGLEPLRLR